MSKNQQASAHCCCVHTKIIGKFSLLTLCVYQNETNLCLINIWCFVLLTFDLRAPTHPWGKVIMCKESSWLTDIHKPTKCRRWWPQMKLKSKSLPIGQCHMQNAWQGPALHHRLLVFLFLADQIFYRSYINRQHFRLRSFASLCSAVQYFWGRRSFQIRYAVHFLLGLAMIFMRDSLSVRSFLIAAMTRYSGFFQLSLVMRFACDIGQSGVITICI